MLTHCPLLFTQHLLCAWGYDTIPGASHLAPSLSPRVQHPTHLRLKRFPTHEGTEPEAPPLVNSRGLRMKPLVTRKGRVLPKVTQQAGTAQANAMPAQTWDGETSGRSLSPPHLGPGRR